MENSKLLFIKKGDFKSGFFSKVSASEFSFYVDRIIIRPMGWNRFFNSAETLILKEDIIHIKDGVRIIGYNIKVETNRGEFTFSFMGDKLQIKQILNQYILKE
jgi:hypothetical protein